MDKSNNNHINGNSLANGAAGDSDDSERWEDFFGSSTDISPSVIEYYDRLSQNIDQKPQTIAATVAAPANATTTCLLSVSSTSNTRATTAASNGIVVIGSSSSSSNHRQSVHRDLATADIDPKPAQCALDSSQQPHQPQQTRHDDRAPAMSSRKIDDRRPFTRIATTTPATHQSPQPPSQPATDPSAVASCAAAAAAAAPPVRSTSPKKAFNVLSHNVSRMLAHASRESIGEQQQPQHPDRNGASAVSQSAAVCNTTIVPNSSPASVSAITAATIPSAGSVSKRQPSTGKHHTTNLPLSRNTSKLTQLGGGGNAMVDAYELQQQQQQRSPKDANTCSGYFGSDVATSDSDKTPTNVDCAQPRFVFAESAGGGGKAVELAAKPVSAVADDDGESSDEHYEDCITEAINFMVNVPDVLQPLKARAQRKLCTIQERKNMLYPNGVKNSGNKTPLILSPTSTSPAIISQTVAKAVRKVTPPPVLVMPDLARLKHHRPLSASSISSTTSSSSSGSEHQLHHHHHLTHLANGGAKLLNVSYLASVESLADQSEGEHLAGGPGGGQIMTVCERACREIVDSERSYVEDLGQVIKGYLEDWKERACLNHNQLRILFSNIEEVYAFNKALLQQLIEAGNDPRQIAQCFIDQRDQFDAYTVYCTSYPEATSLLTALLQASHTNALLTSTQKMLRHRLPLGSYLLKPVQRILKYHLLLENLRKHSESNETVQQAHVLMKEVGRNIDQVKRNREQLSRVKELSGILDGWLGPELTVLGELKLDGLLLENNKPRTVLLFQTMLIITKNKEDNRLQFKTYIHGNHLMLIEHLPGEPTSFTVIPYNDPHPVQIKLTARNRNEKRQWAQHIKQVMLAHFDIPSRAKELVFKLGDEEDRSPDKNTWKWNNTSSTSTPEYLERRNQYRRSEMRYRSKKMRKPSLTAASSFSLDSKSATAVAILQRQTPPAAATGCGEQHRDGEQCNCALVKEQLTTALSEKQLQSAARDRREVAARSRSEPRLPDAVFRSTRSKPPHHQSHAANTGSSAANTSNTSLAHNNGSGDTITVKSVGSSSQFASTAKQSSGQQHSTANTSHLLEVKMYNTKTLPKRIATLKKQRAKTSCGPAKETFKFYMDFSPIEDTTVLRITESTEDLSGAGKATEEQHKDRQPASNGAETTSLPPSTPTKAINDVAIISDLLMEKHRQSVERILKKPQKKLSLEMPRRASSGTLMLDASPSPPSQIARSLSFEDNNAEPSAEQPTQREPQIITEPIYESLLRNVHVPYKFSPILSRSISQPHYRFAAQSVASVLRASTSFAHNRGSSAAASENDATDDDDDGDDYVSLEYSEVNGALQRVDGQMVPPRQPRNATVASVQQQHDVFRNSDTNINYTAAAVSTPKNSRSTFQADRNAAGSTQTEPQLHQLSRSRNASFSSLQSSPQPAESAHALRKCRSGADTTAGRLAASRPFTLIHRQGSESLGSRIAQLDYADPRTLFGDLSRRPSTLSMATSTSTVTEIPVHREQQRDSAVVCSSSVSLASSTESFHTANGGNASSTFGYPLGMSDSFYEQSVEDLLENNMYADVDRSASETAAISSRDSAIYSGSGEEEQTPNVASPQQAEPHHIYESPSKLLLSPGKPAIPRKPSTLRSPPPKRSPPPLPCKSARREDGIVSASAKLPLTTSAISTTTPVTPESNRPSWVLRQIKNFDS